MSKRPVQKAGLTVKGPRSVRDLSVQFTNSTTINIRCRDAQVTARLLELIDQLRAELRAEEESA